MGTLEGKTFLITGVMTDSSLAYAVAERCLAEGAKIILTGAGRAMKLTLRMAGRLADGTHEIPVHDFDVTSTEERDALAQLLLDQGVELAGALHAIGFMPSEGLQEDFLEAEWADIAVGHQISAYSLVELAKVVAPLMPNGGDIVALDFDNSSRTWGPYGHMGPAKVTLQANARYLATQLGPKGIRVNLVAAGPMRTMAAKSIPGFSQFEDIWDERAPLGWDVDDRSPVADACQALFQGLFPKTTGAVFPVDGGFMVVGA